MTTRFGDAPTVPDTLMQWRSAIHAIVAISRFRNSLPYNARQQGLGCLELSQLEIQTTQNGPTSKHDDTLSQASQSEETNQASQKALDKALEDTNPEVEALKLIRDELVKQLDAYGLVLVLLAGITFIAILQPPGSFDNGKLQESLPVSLFMLLATLSFFIACTGLGAVMVGCAQLLRPSFYPKLRTYNVTEGLLRMKKGPTTETPAKQVFINRLLGCQDVGPHSAAIDDIKVLAKFCIANIYRVKRVRIYLGVALVLCIAAYICGALAVMVANDQQRYMLIGAMAVGGVIVLYESCITVSAAVKPESKTIDREGHPHLQTQPYIELQ